MARFLFLLALLALSAFLLFGCLGSESPPLPPAPDYNPNGTLNTTPPYLNPVPLNPVPATPTSPLAVSFINVGYGDATLIQSDGKTILFDAGPTETSGVVTSYLRSRGVEKIDLLVLSSNNPLFVGAAPSILRQFSISQVWINGVDYPDENWQFINEQMRGIPNSSVQYGSTGTFGKLNITVLNPQEQRSNGNPDTDSLVLKLDYGKFCAVLFSNSEASAASGSDPGTVIGGVDARIATGVVPVAGCQLLRVSHHGSGNSASFQFLERMKPETAVISVGPNPPTFAYPEPTAIRRLMLRNVSVYITDKLGTIEVDSDGLTYNVVTERPYAGAYRQFLGSIYDGAKYWR